MNMKVLKRQRKLVVGDIFALQILPKQYHFGRIIRLDAKIVAFRDCILGYVYNATSDSKTDIPELSKNDLLIRPFMTNQQPWTKGYFEIVRREPLEPEDVLTPHCFELNGMFFDEYNNRLPERIEPCGFHGLGSYRTIDVEISRALGIPLSED